MKFVFTTVMAIGPSLLLLLHGLYDFPLFVLRGLEKQGTGQEGLALAMFIFFVAILIFEITWTLRIVRRLRREQVHPAPVLYRGKEE